MQRKTEQALNSSEHLNSPHILDSWVLPKTDKQHLNLQFLEVNVSERFAKARKQEYRIFKPLLRKCTVPPWSLTDCMQKPSLPSKVQNPDHGMDKWTALHPQLWESKHVFLGLFVFGFFFPRKESAPEYKKQSHLQRKQKLALRIPSNTD